MPRQGLGHSSVDIYNMVTPGTDDPIWRHPGAGQLMVGYQQTRSNFVLFSQDATDTEAWTKQNTAISTTLYEAPDNSTTANAIKSNTTGSKNYYLQQQSLSVTAGKTYTASVHLKKGALGFGWLRAGDGTTNYSAAFNLNTGAVTNTSQVLSTSVDAMDDDWFRCSVTFQAQNTSSNGNVIVFAQIDATDNTPNVAVSDVELLYVWGWQLEENSEMSAYIVTTNAARTTTETLNDTSETWDFDSADLMPEADPDDDGVWEVPANVVLNGDYEELGSEEVTNGDFNNGSASWINVNDATFENSSVIFTNGARIYKSVVSASSLIYKIVIDFSNISGDGVQILVGNGNSFVNYSVSDIVNNNNQIVAYSSFVGSSLLFIYSLSTNTNATITNVSVKQVDPNDRWSLGTGWSIEDGKLKCDGTNTDFQSAQQNNITTVGDTYEVTVTVEATSGAVELKGSGVYTRIDSLGVGTHTFNVVADATYIRFLAHASSTITLDNFTVREYAIQPQDV